METTVIVGITSVGTLVIGKLFDLAIERLKSKDAKAVTLNATMNDHSKVVFEQQTGSLKLAWERAEALQKRLDDTEEKNAKLERANAAQARIIEHYETVIEGLSHETRVLNVVQGTTVKRVLFDEAGVPDTVVEAPLIPLQELTKPFAMDSDSTGPSQENTTGGPTK